MSSANPSRWALSFADLCLVLLAFFVLLQARTGDQARVTQGIRQAFGGNAGQAAASGNWRAAELFEPGEAVLRPAAAVSLAALARKAASARSVVIASSGTDGGSHRLDTWELAAARAAAVARAIQAGGVPEGRVTVSIPGMGGNEAGRGQRISVAAR